MKRFVNLIGLMVVLVLLVLPMTAFAESAGVQDEAELRAQLETSQTVVITGEIELTEDLTIPSGKTVCLVNGAELYVPWDRTLTNYGCISMQGGCLAVYGNYFDTDSVNNSCGRIEYYVAYYSDSEYFVDGVGGDVVWEKLIACADLQDISELAEKINSVGFFQSEICLTNCGPQTLASDIEIPYGVTLCLDTKLTVPSGVTIDNHGGIDVGGSGTIALNGTIRNENRLQVSGAITGSGTIENKGTIVGEQNITGVKVNNTQSDGIDTEKKLRDRLASGASRVEITGSIKLTTYLEIPRDATVAVCKGGSLTVPGDDIEGSYLYGEDGILELRGGELITDGRLSMWNPVEVYVDYYDTDYMPAGLPEEDVIACVEVTDASKLSAAMASLVTRYKPCAVIMRDCAPQTLASDLIIPADVTLEIGTKLSVPASCMVTIEGGALAVMPTGEIVLDGIIFDKNGWLYVGGPITGSGAVMGTGGLSNINLLLDVPWNDPREVHSEEPLRFWLEYYDGEITIDRSIGLTSSLVIPKGKAVTLRNDLTLTVPEGYDLGIRGTLNLNGRLLDYGTIDLSGTINGSGMTVVADGGHFNPNSGSSYDESTVHIVEGWDDGKEPTCIAPGIAGCYKCSSCSYYFDKNYNLIDASQLALPATGNHIAGEGQEATCTTKAVCKYCGESFGELAPHDLTENIKDANCEEDGESITTCFHCDYRVEKIIPALGHSKGDHHEATPPTCSADGNKVAYYDCSNNCGAKLDAEGMVLTDAEVVIPATGIHIPGTMHTDKAATCTEAGNFWYYDCSGNCGTLLDIEGKVTTEEDIIIPALNHNPGTEHPEEAATCTAPGTKAHYTCSRCSVKVNADGTELTDADLVIEMLGHNYSSEVTVKPTCTETGIETFTCSRGDDSYTKTIPATDHAWGEYTELTAATCTKNATEVAHCQNEGCKATDNREAADTALGHNYSSEVTVKPTCTETGIETYTCTRGDDSYTETIPATGHSYNEKGVCTVCGEEHTHTGTAVAVKPATDSADGTKAHYKCDCGKLFEDKACTKEVTADQLVIAKVKSVTIASSSYTYNGKVKNPAVTVKDASGNTLVKGTDYTVTYSKGCKDVGSYTVTVKGKGNYSFTKTLTFRINPVKTAIAKLTAGKKAFTVKWKKKTTQVTGYQIQYSLKKSFASAKTVTVKGASTVSKTIKKLKAGKTYYVRVRTYKTVGKTKFYSDWSAAKSIKTKK